MEAWHALSLIGSKRSRSEAFAPILRWRESGSGCDSAENQNWGRASILRFLACDSCSRGSNRKIGGLTPSPSPQRAAKELLSGEIPEGQSLEGHQLARPEGPSCNSHDRKVVVRDTEPGAVATGIKAQLSRTGFSFR